MTSLTIEVHARDLQLQPICYISSLNSLTLAISSGVEGLSRIMTSSHRLINVHLEVLRRSCCNS